jgi:hypothetical protein
MVNQTMRNRRARVNRMLRTSNNVRSRKLQRQPGKRYLTKPSHIRFSNNVSYSNNNYNTEFNNNNFNHTRALVNSRKSITVSRPLYRLQYGFSPREAKLYANLSAKYNSPENLANAIMKNESLSNNDRELFLEKIRANYL